MPSGYSVSGTDVSDNNDPIDWSKVAGSGAQFAYVKATEGDNYTNSYYASDVKAARAQGLYVGAYAFARPDKNDPVTQADRFASVANYSADGKTLLPFVDLEFGTTVGEPNCYGLAPSALVSWIKSYLGELTSKFGTKPMIYTAAGWWNPCTGSSTAFGSYVLDVADYGASSPTLPAGWSKFTFWQYTDNAGISGSAKALDGDVFNGTSSELAAFAGGKATSSASSVAFASSGGNPFVAFRASGTGTKLWTWTGKLNTAGNGTASNDGVAAGTTPSIAVLPNGNLVVAFQAAGDNKLWIWTGAPNTAGNGTATNDGMAPGTSPSLALTPSGVAVVAFQANGGKLWTWTGKLNTAGNGTATDDGMAAGTSPSIALPGGGNPVVAFQANGGKLWTWTGALNTAGNGTATNDGMAPGTSPSLALLPGGDPVVAFQANSSGYLWTWTGKVNTTGNATATNDGMAPNTSPSIALPPAGGNPVVAFQANGGKLWTWTGKAATAGNGTPTLDGMAPGASPSIALPPAGGNPVVAFKANNTNLLWIWTGAANTAGNGTPTNDGMA